MSYSPYQSNGTIRNPVSSLCSTCAIATRCRGCYRVDPRFLGDSRDPSKLRYLFLGEAPGAKEVTDKKPFVGRSGKLLWELVSVVGIPQDQILVSNACWCPPRAAAGEWIGTPSFDEVLHCVAHSLMLLVLYRPKVLVTAGSIPWKAVCNPPGKSVVSGITRKHGEWHSINIPYWVQYETFYLWVRSKVLQAKLSSFDSERKIYFGTKHNAQTDEAKCREQVEKAKTELGYDEEWLKTPVLPILHPAYILRNGRGPSSQESEDTVFDLQKAKHLVEGTVFDKAETNYRWITELDDWIKYVDETIQLHKDGTVPLISLDLESSELETNKVLLSCFHPGVKILTLQFSRYDNEAVALMVNHSQSKFNDAVSMQILRHHLERLIQTVPTVYQNGVFDVNMLRCKLGLDGFKVVGDTMLMDHWLRMGMQGRSGLDDIGNRYLGTGKHKTPALEWRAENPKKTFDDMPLDIALNYACGDSDITRRAYWEIKKELVECGRWEHYWEHYYGRHKGWEVICDLVYYGMPVDKEKLDALHSEYPQRIEDVVQKINSNCFVISWLKKRYDAYLDPVTKHNDGVPGTRKKFKKVLTLEDFLKHEDHRFNPSSVPQTIDLWQTLDVLWNDSPDTEWDPKDVCNSCRRERCKCVNPHVRTRFITSDNNRDIAMNLIDKRKEEYRKAGDTEQVRKWERIKDLFELTSEFKKLAKMYGTYVKGIYSLIIDQPEVGVPWDSKDRVFELYRPYCKFPRAWCLHPGYNMHGTDTGRLSSSRPNAQNFPSKSGDPKANIKAPYISRWAGKGGLLVQPDYSQIEIRVMVSMAGATKAAEILNSGKDIHRFVASLVHGISEDQVTDDIRTPVKRVTFGIIYGQSVASLAQELHIPTKAAQDIQNRLFGEFPEFEKFIERQHNEARMNMLVVTPLGRVRFLEGMGSDNPGEVNTVLREAVNTPVQSVASDLCWQAYGRAWQDIKRYGLTAFPHSIIHDSQCFDVSPGQFFDVVELQYYQMVWKTMEIYPWLIVKPEADFSIGTSWGTFCKCKLFWNESKTKIVHDKIGLSGRKEDIDAIQAEMETGSLYPVVDGADGQHPKEAEAKKGIWYRELRVKRASPRILLQGNILEIMNGA